MGIGKGAQGAWRRSEMGTRTKEYTEELLGHIGAQVELETMSLWYIYLSHTCIKFSGPSNYLFRKHRLEEILCGAPEQNLVAISFLNSCFF